MDLITTYRCIVISTMCNGPLLIGEGAVRASGRERGRHDAYKRCSRLCRGLHSYSPTLQTTSHRPPGPTFDAATPQVQFCGKSPPRKNIFPRPLIFRLELLSVALPGQTGLY